MAIGESSNLAQLALSYTYNFDDKIYQDAVCILSVVAQAAIDNAKRKFDIDIPNEIARIKSMLNINQNGLPSFWMITKKDKRKARTNEIRYKRIKENKEKIQKKINVNLKCPMNYLYDLKLNKYRSSQETIPFEKFFINHELKNDFKKARKIEELIEKYSFKLNAVKMSDESLYESDDDLLLRADFDKLVQDIRTIGISRNYIGFMSYLIKRAFKFGGVKRTVSTLQSQTDKNKSTLLKVLYECNKSLFLRCFLNELKK